jgi:hypothetical protein
MSNKVFILDFLKVLKLNYALKKITRVIQKYSQKYRKIPLLDKNSSKAFFGGSFLYVLG